MRKAGTLAALFPRVRQGVLATTLMQPEKWWYLSELATAIGTRPSSLQRELAALVEIGILERRREGARTYFRAERRSPIFRELRSIFEKTAGIVPVLNGMLLPFGSRISSAFIYGSIASGKEHASSDIDLMVIGSVGISELASGLRAAEKRIGRAVNVTNYSTQEFRNKAARGDHFLNAVLRKPKRFLKGTQDELEAIARQ
jgi:predicted nucleotidyltransferase